MEGQSYSVYLSLLFILVALLPFGSPTTFSIEEATLASMKDAFNQNQLTSRQLVEFYLEQISKYNASVRAVIETNPDALTLADKADSDRLASMTPRALPILHGIPVLLKDSIATKDNLNTTSGSYALLKSIVPRDAGVVTKLRNAGAIILGKASLSQWSGLRSTPGWNSRTGQGHEPYTLGDPCGSSSGSAISVSANMAAVSIGTETDGSLLCPASYNSVVAIKPTVGLTSRSGVIPISPRQDSVGSIGRTVADATHVLDAIVGSDVFDPQTSCPSRYIPKGGYTQFLNNEGLRGKRLGIVSDFSIGPHPSILEAFERTLPLLSEQGAILVYDLSITDFETITNNRRSREIIALLNEFKGSLNVYLQQLISSQVRSLSDIILFNDNNENLENVNEHPQVILRAADATNGEGMGEILGKLRALSTQGFEKTMTDNRLDAIITPNENISSFLAIGGLPGITVPAGYLASGEPFGFFFGGLKGYEPRLIEIAYAFEQATNVRRPPRLTQSLLESY